MDVAGMSAEQAVLLLQVLENHGLLLRLDGELYGTFQEGGAWHIWKLEQDATVHSVTGDACTCGVHGCVHVRGVKYGSDTAEHPWKYKRLHKKRKVRNPRDRDA